MNLKRQDSKIGKNTVLNYIVSAGEANTINFYTFKSSDLKSTQHESDDDDDCATNHPFFSITPKKVQYYEDGEIRALVDRLWNQYDGINSEEIPELLITDLLGSHKIRNDQHNLVFDVIAEQYGEKIAKNKHYELLKNLRSNEDLDHE